MAEPSPINRIQPEEEYVAYRRHHFAPVKKFFQNNKKRVRNTLVTITALAVLAAGIAFWPDKKEANTNPTTSQTPTQNPITQTVKTAHNSGVFYEVKKGDYLWNIAKQHGQQTEQEIVSYIRAVQEINDVPEEKDILVYDFATQQLKPGQDGLADLVCEGERLRLPTTETPPQDYSQAKNAVKYVATVAGIGLGLGTIISQRKKSKGKNDDVDLEELVRLKNQNRYSSLDQLATKTDLPGINTKQDVKKAFSDYFSAYPDRQESPIVERYDSNIETEKMAKDRQVLYAQTTEDLSQAMKSYLSENYQDTSVSSLTVKEILTAYTAVHGMKISKTTFYTRNKKDLCVESRKQAMQKQEID